MVDTKVVQGSIEVKNGDNLPKWKNQPGSQRLPGPLRNSDKPWMLGQTRVERLMKHEFELEVQHVPLPDAEERLQKVFDILLKPISDHQQEEPHPAQSHVICESLMHPTDSTRQTLIKNRVDIT